MTSPEDTAIFTLSREEVYALLNRLRARGMLGVDPAPLAAFDGDQRQAVLDAAERALLARGILTLDAQGNYGIDAAVRAAIHAAAFARRTLALITRRAGEMRQSSYLVYHAEPIWVEHVQPLPGLHEFTLTAGCPAIQSRFEQLLNIADQPAPPAEVIHLTQAELDALQAAVTAGSDDLPTLVSAAGADAATAGIFAELLSGPRDSAIVQATVHAEDGGEEQTTTITILHNHHGFWLMQAPTPTELICRPADAALVRRTVADVIAML